jgi:hypothetical protein
LAAAATVPTKSWNNLLLFTKSVRTSLSSFKIMIRAF